MRLGEVTLGLIERDLEGARIDYGKQIALVDELAFLKIHADQRPVDLRLYGNGIESRHGAEPFEINRHIAKPDSGCNNRNAARPGHASQRA